VGGVAAEFDGRFIATVCIRRISRDVFFCFESVSDQAILVTGAAHFAHQNRRNGQSRSLKPQNADRCFRFGFAANKSA